MTSILDRMLAISEIDGGNTLPCPSREVKKFLKRRRCLGYLGKRILSALSTETFKNELQDEDPARLADGPMRLFKLPFDLGFVHSRTIVIRSAARVIPV